MGTNAEFLGSLEKAIGNVRELHKAEVAWTGAFWALPSGSLTRWSFCAVPNSGRGFRSLAVAPLAGTSPPSPFGLRRDSLRSFRYDGLRVACRAVARETSEGWWARQGSNL